MTMLNKLDIYPNPEGVDTYHYHAPWYLAGDANGDWNVNAGDVVYLINYLYRNGLDPIPSTAAGDVTCDGIVNAGDVIYLVTYLYRGGPPPSC